MSDVAGSPHVRRTREVAAVVLAAGQATRMGEQKLLLPVGEHPMVRRVVDAALGSRAARTIVVVGHESDAVLEALDGAPVLVAMNAEYADGMSTSLQAGLRASAGSCDAAIFLLGDQPYVTSTLIDEMIDRFVSTNAAVVRPAVCGRPANPVLMGSALFAEILEQRGDVGGREIVERHSDEVSLVSVDDPQVCIDIDSPQEYEATGEVT
jgi:molybdenum cofactor cytidylyltransferase